MCEGLLTLSLPDSGVRKHRDRSGRGSGTTNNYLRVDILFILPTCSSTLMNMTKIEVMLVLLFTASVL